MPKTTIRTTRKKEPTFAKNKDSDNGNIKGTKDSDNRKLKGTAERHEQRFGQTTGNRGNCGDTNTTIMMCAENRAEFLTMTEI